jgi:hypothetical protein
LNGICEVNENCAVVENTICIGGRCRCQNYYVQEDGQCNGASRRGWALGLVSIVVILLHI